MAYHTPLKTSKDYYTALKMARSIAANITIMLNNKLGPGNEVEVFPYRFVCSQVSGSFLACLLHNRNHNQGYKEWHFENKEGIPTGVSTWNESLEHIFL